MVFNNNTYAVLKRKNLSIHLQWHANTKDAPLLGGSVVKFFVKNIHPIFEEFVKKIITSKDKLNLQTAWNTNEFGFYNLNNNAIFFVENIKS